MDACQYYKRTAGYFPIYKPMYIYDWVLQISWLVS